MVILDEVRGQTRFLETLSVECFEEEAPLVLKHAGSDPHHVRHLKGFELHVREVHQLYPAR